MCECLSRKTVSVWGGKKGRKFQGEEAELFCFTVGLLLGLFLISGFKEGYECVGGGGREWRH